MKIKKNLLKDLVVLFIIAVFILSTMVSAETVNFNDPPISPSKPNGPTQGKLNIEYTFCTTVTNPENNMVYYLWDWGDGTTSDWFGPYQPGETACASHTWINPGTYCIKVTAKDDIGTDYGWSEPLCITIDNNYPPNAPTITGPSFSKPNIPYECKIVTIDPDGDNVSYEIDWGDGVISDWTDWYLSGEEIIQSHYYSEKIHVKIKARAKDTDGAIGEWGSIIIPREYLYKTIILITNNPEVKELLNKYKKDKRNYNQFFIKNNTGFINEVNNIITNDNILSERISTIKIINKENPIICGLLIIIFTPIVNMLNDLEDKYENNPLLFSMVSTLNLLVSIIYIILAGYFDCGISPY